MLTLPKAVIFGCQGLTLTPQEENFFRRQQPLGFILFSRNCDSPSQIQELIKSLKSCVNHSQVPILIDQEGGRVARLKPPHWRHYPPAALFGQIAEEDMELALWASETNAFILGHELAALGINVNCAPVLDLPIPGAHPIISDRAFHEIPEIAAKLALATYRGFARNGVTSVIKHLPGHGRAPVDSHENLPVVNIKTTALKETDFESFRLFMNEIHNHRLKSPWGMTAHICYTDIDNSYPATQSSVLISSIIRQYIGFNGILLSDCLTMKALEGSFAERTEQTLKAGCDVALHCSGDIEEMIEVASATTRLSPQTWERCQTTLITGTDSSTTDIETLYATLQKQTGFAA